MRVAKLILGSETVLGDSFILYFDMIDCCLSNLNVYNYCDASICC